jgi:hypothetical protein
MLKSKANDNILTTCYPEYDIYIGGEWVTVREFTFLQGLRAAQIAQMLLADLAVLFKETEANPGFFAITGIFGEHEKELLGLISMATGRDTKWLRELTESEEQQLITAFWTVNWPFFVNRLIPKLR